MKLKKFILFVIVVLVVSMFVVSCENYKTGRAYTTSSTPYPSEEPTSLEEPIGTPEEPAAPAAPPKEPEKRPEHPPPPEKRPEHPPVLAPPKPSATPSATPKCDPNKCSAKSGWYDTGDKKDKKWVKVDDCMNKEIKKQENMFYYCNKDDQCVYSVKSTREMDTGKTNPKRDWTVCDLSPPLTPGPTEGVTLSSTPTSTPEPIKGVCKNGKCVPKPKKCIRPEDCYDGDDCTEDICNKKKECENPDKANGADCNPSPSSTPQPDSSPPPESGKDGFCKDGECIEKNCNNIYGPGYIECPKGSTDYAMCCGPDEKCCDDNEAADPICCSNLEHGWLIGLADEHCEAFSEEDDGEQVDINYCDPEKCLPPRSQRCSTFWKAICCLPQPQEYCGVEVGGYDTPFCGVKSVCPKGTTFECYREVVWGKDNVLCCITGEESCETTPLGDKKFCRPYKCKSEETLCEGEKDYLWESKCCEKGEACFHQPNGRPKCEEI